MEDSVIEWSFAPEEENDLLADFQGWGGDFENSALYIHIYTLSVCVCACLRPAVGMCQASVTSCHAHLGSVVVVVSVVA